MKSWKPWHASQRRPSLRHLFFVLREKVPHVAGLLLMGTKGTARGEAGRAESSPGFLNRFGDGHVIMQAGGLRLPAGAGSFFQPSEAAAEALIQLVLEMAALNGDERVVDLYCGVGTFTVPLAQRATS